MIKYTFYGFLVVLALIALILGLVWVIQTHVGAIVLCVALVLAASWLAGVAIQEIQEINKGKKVAKPKFREYP